MGFYLTRCCADHRLVRLYKLVCRIRTGEMTSRIKMFQYFHSRINLQNMYIFVSFLNKTFCICIVQEIIQIIFFLDIRAISRVMNPIGTEKYRCGCTLVTLTSELGITGNQFDNTCILVASNVGLKDFSRLHNIIMTRKEILTRSPSQSESE